MVEQKLERYFAASAGVVLTAVWLVAGFGSTLVCVLGGAAFYGAAAFARRQPTRRLVEVVRAERGLAAAVPSRRRATKAPARDRHGIERSARTRTPRIEIAPVDSEPESRETLAAHYGW